MTVEKNKSYIIKIEGISHQAMGVGRVDGFVVFVHEALPGEEVKAKIVSIKKDYAYAIIEEFINKSDERSKPLCLDYKRCGGCSMQHMTYDFQLKCKTQRVKDCFSRIAKMDNIKVNTTIGMDVPKEYRNKVQFPIRLVDGKIQAGFYARRSHNIIPCNNCIIQPAIFNDIKDTVIQFLAENKISVYDETKNTGLVRHLVVRANKNQDSLMVIIVISKEEEGAFNGISSLLTNKYPAIKSIVLNINNRRTNVIMGTKDINIYGEGFIIDTIGEFKYKISPLSFFQINPVQTKVIYDKALELVNLTGKETVFDLYCGAGTISLYLSKYAKNVIGVESVPEAIESAKQNAKLNNIKNTEFFAGKAEQIVPKLYDKGIKADVVVLDPPRKGCHETLLNTLVEMQPKTIVYVSCNPSTLARDAAYITEHNYGINEVQPVDMFPHTEHVETVVLMSRVEK